MRLQQRSPVVSYTHLGQSPQIHGSGRIIMKDQIESSLWILGNSQISGQIIAGAGGNVAEDDFGRICNALKGLVYRAVTPQNDER